MTTLKSLKLGLIGDNIARSRSPLLHRLAGQQNGVEVTYDRLVPREMDLGFDEICDGCARQGYRGINVTYPYKESAARRVEVDDPLVRAIGAVNTVIFGEPRPKGFNTDYSGFMAAYRRVIGEAATGTALMIGTGGVGRAVAFGLAGLGTRSLRLVDRDPAKAEALAEALKSVAPDMEISIWLSADKAAEGCSGLINCTPVGMVGHEGTPLAPAAMNGASWAFDAVYTPADTQFLQDAAAAGLKVISGWELYFFQGVHAWRLFSGLGLDAVALRSALLEIGEAL
ncbi:shikimate dehydrogenase family protein [Salipiger mangrovisoli]|uniref:Shikimate dehydrogenase n=1 Tax=Salipiger mangrovisoli TaxID=2865933 RepID=A0ABR9X938_9RHOB|nr:shikimate dehydrogenase [Salipiger mangrovisoli]MBE9640125.1 shikimate dehydrogenase [Salipiger mangrovisoli]